MAPPSRPGATPRSYAQDFAHSVPAWAATIRRRRLELGLTQEAVAALASVSRGTVVALEHGRTTVSMAHGLAVLGVLGMGLSIARAHPGEISASA